MNVPTPTARRDALTAQAAALIAEILADQDITDGGGLMSPSAYDTAWLAMVRAPQAPDRLAFPRALTMLLDMQRPDGSFAATFPHNIVPTLAAALSLTRAHGTHPEVQPAQAAAVAFLRSALPRWELARFEAIGFEVIVPYLLEALEHAGISLDFPARPTLMAQAARKLALIKPESLYDNLSALVHSLEALSGRLDLQRCRTLRHPNGSYGGSPAATAAVLIAGPWDPTAARWLARRLERGAPSLAHPLTHFELTWVLGDLLRADRGLGARLPTALREAVLAELEADEHPEGRSSGRQTRWPADGDNSAVNLTVRQMLGRPVPNERFCEAFFTGEHFRTYTGERSPSLTTNAHALEALSLAPGRAALARPRLAALTYILDTQRRDGSWSDKWHISALYATACSVHALQSHGGDAAIEAIRRAQSWVLECTTGGGWGLHDGPTAEETAYAVAILTAAGRHPAAGAALESADRFLARPLTTDMLVPLWISKQLYTVARVVRGAVLSAQISLTH